MYPEAANNGVNIFKLTDFNRYVKPSTGIDTAVITIVHRTLSFERLEKPQLIGIKEKKYLLDWGKGMFTPVN